MILIVLFWILLLLYGIRYNKHYDNDPFSSRHSLALRGICAVEIMIGHLGLPNATNSLFLYPNRKAGILFVGIFLALSGYGLIYSLRSKKDYMRHFLWKRISKVLFPAYVVYMVSIFTNVRDAQFFQLFDMKKFFLTTNWYVWEIILLYIGFFICFKYLKRPWNIISLFVFLTGFIIVAFILKIDKPWYGSTLCFGLGILYGEKDGFRFSNIKLYKYSSLFMLGGVVGLAIALFYVLGEQSVIGNPIARNVASVAFVLMTIGLLYRFKIGNNCSAFLGKYSYEIFLMHPLFIELLRPSIENDFIYAVAVIICTIVSAYAIKQAGRFLVNTSKNWIKS